MRKFRAIFFWGLFLAVFLSGCSQNNSPANQAATKNAETKKINIVTTIFPQYDFTRAIVGDRANLTMLISPGASVHSFDPSPADIKKIGSADVFIYIGGESETWVERILKPLPNPPSKIIRLLDYVTTLEEERAEGMEPDEPDHAAKHTHAAEHGHAAEGAGEHEEELPYDEHIWTSPPNAVKLISAIAAQLSAADSENAAFYQQNAQNYIREVEALDNEFKNIVKEGKRQKLIVADRFPLRYFAAEYGLSYRAAFAGCSDQTDASVKTIAYLVNTVQREKIPCVYHLELSSQKVAQAISAQTGVPSLLFHSGHNLSKTDFEAGVTYVELMHNNAANLRKGLN